MARNTLLRIAAGIGLAAYCLVSGAKSYEIHRKLNPIRGEFAETAYRTRFWLEEEGSFLDAPKSISFGGRLDEILEKRDKFLDNNGCFLFGGWNVRTPDARSLYVNTGAPVVCPLL